MIGSWDEITYIDAHYSVVLYEEECTMEKKSNDVNGKQESHVRQGGDSHRSKNKKPEGPVQGFSQAPRGLQ